VRARKGVVASRGLVGASSVVADGTGVTKGWHYGTGSTVVVTIPLKLWVLLKRWAWIELGSGHGEYTPRSMVGSFPFLEPVSDHNSDVEAWYWVPFRSSQSQRLAREGRDWRSSKVEEETSITVGVSKAC